MRRWLHRKLWQSLPQNWRQKFFLFITTLLAPRPDRRPPQAAEPLYIVGSLCTASGLGAAARLGLEALSQGGWDVRGLDLTGALMHDAKRIDYAFRDAGAMEGDGTVILYLSPALTAFAMLKLGRRRLRGKTIVAYWAWELPDLPRQWRSAFRFIHEIWAPSRFTASAFQRHTQLPVRVLPYPVPPLRDDRITELRKDTRSIVLVVFDMASGLARKNPLAAIETFRRTFANDPEWRLIIKVTDADKDRFGRQALEAAITGVSNITIDCRLLTVTDIQSLIASCDVLLSLHRAEGFGLVLAEAMRLGKVIVGTDWSGNTDFLNGDNGCPVAFRLVPVHDPEGRYVDPEQVWAEPDVDDAVRQLKRLRDPVLRRHLGKKAQKSADQLFSIERYNAEVAQYLGLRPAPSFRISIHQKLS